MLRVYNYMASGVLLSGIVAFLIANSPSAIQVVFGSPLKWVVMLAPLGFVLVLSAGINRLSVFAAQALYWAFAACMGASLASILLVFTGESVARVFFITAATFAGMSLYGYTTKADLSKFGSFLFMGLIGIVIAGLVNIFVASSALQFAISVVGVLVFTGLTAYDTQQIKDTYYESAGGEVAGKMALMGALRLYLDFINLFMMLMQLLGQRRD
ncbi:MAG TPA: Bax inhibitor-1/YccA family protein [Alphaproteobacteria bacterium]|nr:Bax inhibitor-1/YccA family protein [Alphaproteobacteria bacterium]